MNTKTCGSCISFRAEREECACLLNVSFPEGDYRKVTAETKACPIYFAEKEENQK